MKDTFQEPFRTKEQLDSFYQDNKQLIDLLFVDLTIKWLGQTKKDFIWLTKAKGNVGDIKID